MSFTRKVNMMEMDIDTDILVVGAGVLGLSSAYHIKRQNPEKKVVVIDKLGGPGQGNTAKSAGGYRNLFTSGKNRLLAESTVAWFGYLQEDLGRKIGMTQTGYLYLLGGKQLRKREAALEKMRDSGIELRYHNAEELKYLIPDLVPDFSGDDEAEMMGLDPIEVGVQGVSCGVVDADALARRLEFELIKVGGILMYNRWVKSLILKPREEFGIPGEPFVWQDVAVEGVDTTRGEFKAETTVVATGAWSAGLLDPLGFDSIMRPKKRCIFVFKDPKLERLYKTDGFNDQGVLPFTQLPSAGIYIKPDPSEGSLWVSVTEDLGREYLLEDDPQANEHVYSENAYYALVKYLPCFKDVRPVNMWAGQRAINNFDKIPIVAPGPGFIYVGAATGNGIMKCDALGRLVAAQVSGEEYTELYGGSCVKTSDFGLEERNVEREAF
jgi:glycine/D-amino acid oxidase-like deaminating enzyme